MSRVLLRAASGLLAAGLMICVTPVRADLISVDFGVSASTTALPYTEDGFTFTRLFGNPQVIGTAINTERYLNIVGATSSNGGVRITGPGAFDLQSFDLRIPAAREWTVTASSGATMNILNGAGSGTIDFASLAGWTNLTFVEISHTLTSANANLQLDNFMFNTQAVPEPGSLALMAVTGGALGLTRLIRRRGQGATNR